MDLSKIIDHLNQKKYATFLQYSDLSEEEKQVIDKYEPNKKLIIYGSLAPGRPNHSKVEHISGNWYKGIIRGILESKGWGANLGYNGYRRTNTPEDNPIEAFILFSDELGAHYALLDDFEGDEYERILAIFELENGVIGVGNIYALKGE